MSETERVSSSRRKAAVPSDPSGGHATSSRPTTAKTSWLGPHVGQPFALGGLVQPQLTVGPVDDPFEREADSVAAHVTGSATRPPPPISRASTGSLGSVFQRAALGTDEEQEEQPSQAGTVRRKSAAPAGPAGTAGMHTAASHAVASRGPGSPLDGGTRGVLESRLAVDLSSVRVHRDAGAEHSASALHARAFTHGSNIWLGRGESPSDLRLMAHEVTHVVQQDGVVRRKPADDIPEEEPTLAERERREASELEERRRRAAAMRAGTAAAAPPGLERAREGALTPPERRVATPAPPGTERPAAAETARPGAREPILPAGGTSLTAAAPPSETAVAVERETAATPTETAVAAERETAAAPATPATAPTAAPAAPAAATAPEPVAPAAPVAGAPGARAAPAAAGGAPAAPGAEAEPTAGGAGPSAAITDPRYLAAQARLETLATREKQHPPRKGKVAAAEKATVQPTSEPMALGKAARVAEMSEVAEKGGVVKPKDEPFLALMKKALDDLTPKTPDDVENFGASGGGGGGLKTTMQGGVAQQTAQATGPIETAAQKPPQSTGVETAKPLPTDPREPPPPAVGAADALPQPKPEAAVSMEADKQQADGELAKTGLTEEQLRKANEPTFTAAVNAKEEVKQNSDAGPERYRAAESGYLAGSAEQLAAEEAAGRGGMRDTRQASKAGTTGKQLDLKQQREAARQKVSADIQGMYDTTKAKVEGKLKQLDVDVDTMFETGQKAAFEAMKSGIEDRLTAWKIRRYGSRALIPVVGVLWAAGTWAYDKLRGIDDQPEVKQLYEEERQRYVNAMEALFGRIADKVESTLLDCKADIAAGREQVRVYVAGLGKDLIAFGREAEGKIGAEFAALEQGVDDKKQQLADRMASKAKESREQVDKWLDDERSKNKGLVSKLVGYVREIIETIRKFKERLLGILSKGKSAIDIIIADPIAFLGNILDAVKLGFTQFTGKIVEYLKQGIFGWLFGTLASAGITLPKDFSIRSIFGLVLDILGITYSRIRGKAVKLIGERNVAILEKVWEFISALISGGPAGLWEQIKEFLGDLKDTIIEEVKSWVITNVVKAAVTKLVSMFNPIGAFIQAVMGIYNTVMFFIERINQIIDLVETIVSSVYDIATGKIAAAANWIEQALARTVPIIISFLARLLGLGGVSEKIKEIVGKVQAKVDQAIDKVIAKVIGVVKNLLGGGKKDDPAKKAETGDPAHDAKWTAAVTAVQADIEKIKTKGLTPKAVEEAIPEWKRQHGFTTLTVQASEDEIVLEGAMSPGKVIDSEKRAGSKKNPLKVPWVKPKTADYPVLWFGGRTSKAITQKRMQKLKANGVKVGDEEIEPYYPQKRKKLPGGETIGLIPGWQIPRATPLGPAVDEESPGGAVINAILENYGWRASDEDPPMDGDHVHEIQLSGVDVKENLWPLNARDNRRSGAKIATATIVFPGGGTKKMKELKEENASKKTEYYFEPDFQ